jgi:hypothetical protein
LKANERLEQLRDSINQMQQFRAEHDPLGVDMPIPVTSVSANTVPTFSTGGFSHPTSSAFNAPKTTATTQTSATGSAASQYWAKGTGYGRYASFF